MADSDASGPPEADKELKLRSERLEWVDVEDEIVVLDNQHSIYLAPNSSGAMLWRELADGTTHRELVQALVSAYGISPQQAEDDVGEFISRLGDLGLLA